MAITARFVILMNSRTSDISRVNDARVVVVVVEVVVVVVVVEVVVVT